MAKRYKVWVQIEQINETNKSEDVDDINLMLMSEDFETLADAAALVRTIGKAIKELT